jgi:predicted protein tyrosine phosphatase
MFYAAKRIAPYNMWIGSERDSENVTAARRHGVVLIVNCTKDIPFSVPGTKRARVPVDDHPADAPVMSQHLPRVVKAIDSALSQGKAVLIHCYAGISRSASVAAAYLMFKEGLDPAQAIERIQKLKPETFGSRPNFLAALEDYAALLTKINPSGTQGGVATTRTSRARK